MHINEISLIWQNSLKIITELILYEKIANVDGWSTEGLWRFNEIYLRVITDRWTNPLALTKFIQDERGILHQRHSTSVTKKKRKVVVALADEFSDNENETDYAIEVNTDNTIGTTL